MRILHGCPPASLLSDTDFIATETTEHTEQTIASPAKQCVLARKARPSLRRNKVDHSRKRRKNPQRRTTSLALPAYGRYPDQRRPPRLPGSPQNGSLTPMGKTSDKPWIDPLPRIHVSTAHTLQSWASIALRMPAETPRLRPERPPHVGGEVPHTFVFSSEHT